MNLFRIYASVQIGIGVKIDGFDGHKLTTNSRICSKYRVIVSTDRTIMCQVTVDG